MKKFVLSLFFAMGAYAASAAELVRLPYVLATPAEKQMSSCDTIYTMPTSPAEFPGGMDALYDFYFKSLPKGYDMAMNMSAKIILVKIFVNDKGEVADAKVLKAFNNDYSSEVISVTEKLPRFNPAEYNGRKVCSYRIIKLYFN